MKKILIFFAFFCFFSVFAVDKPEWAGGFDLDRLPDSYICDIAKHNGCKGTRRLIPRDKWESNWPNIYYCDGNDKSLNSDGTLDTTAGSWGPPPCPYLKGCTRCSECNQGCVGCNPDYHSEKKCSSCGGLYRECTGHNCKSADCPNGADCYPCSECGEECAFHNEPYKHSPAWCPDCNSDYFNCVGHNCPNGCPNLSDCNQCSECNKCITHDGGGFDHTGRSCAICFKSFYDCVGHDCAPLGCPDLDNCLPCSNCGVCVTHKSGDFTHSQMTCIKCEQTFWDCAFHFCIDGPDDPDSDIDPDDPDSDIDDGGEYEFPVKISALDIIKQKLLPNFSISVSTSLPNLHYTFSIFGQSFTVGYDFNSGIVSEWLYSFGSIIKTIGQFLMTVIFVFACIRVFKKG